MRSAPTWHTMRERRCSTGRERALESGAAVVIRYALGLVLVGLFGSSPARAAFANDAATIGAKSIALQPGVVLSPGVYWAELRFDVGVLSFLQLGVHGDMPFGPTCIYAQGNGAVLSGCPAMRPAFGLDVRFGLARLAGDLFQIGVELAASTQPGGGWKQSSGRALALGSIKLGEFGLAYVSGGALVGAGQELQPSASLGLELTTWYVHPQLALVAGGLVGAYLGNLFVTGELLPSWSRSVSTPQVGVTLASLRVFDPIPPGTLGEGYLRTACDLKDGHR